MSNKIVKRLTASFFFFFLVSVHYQRSRPIYAILELKNINNRNDKNAKVLHEAPTTTKIDVESM